MTQGPLDPHDAETYRAYYLLQYERIAQHEGQRLQVSNFVVAGSVVGLGVVATDPSHLSTAAFFVPIAIVLVNALAIVYAWNSRKWVKFHQSRARAVLYRLSPSLWKFQSDDFAIQLPGGEETVSKVDSDRAAFRGQLTQSYIHGVLMAISTLVAIAL